MLAFDTLNPIRFKNYDQVSLADYGHDHELIIDKLNKQTTINRPFVVHNPKVCLLSAHFLRVMQCQLIHQLPLEMST